MYGYNNYSYYGRYRTRVKGLLDDIKAIKIFKSAIIVKNEDAHGVIELLQQYEAHIVCKKVILNKEEIEKTWNINIIYSTQHLIHNADMR